MIAPAEAHPPQVDMRARQTFYHQFLKISAIFGAHCIVIAAIVIALISGHH